MKPIALRETPSLTCDLKRKTGIPLSGFGKPVTSDICSVRVYIPTADDTEVRDRSPSETLDLTGCLGGKTGILSGFVGPITMNRQISNDTEARDRWPSEIPDLPGHQDKNTGIKYPCMGLVDRSTVIFALCVYAPRCQTIPTLETDHSQKHWPSQVALVARPAYPCMILVNRPLVMFILGMLVCTYDGMRTVCSRWDGMCCCVGRSSGVW